jgi:hypothetical protein
MALALLAVHQVSQGHPLSAQGAPTPILVGGQPTCGQCRIILGPLVTIRDSVNGSGSINLAAVAMSADGSVLVQDRKTTQFLVYDRTGKFVSTFGRRGNGPGEFASALRGATVVKGDSLWAIDGTADRISVFAPGSRRFVRSFPIPRGLDSWAAVGDSLVVAAFTSPAGREVLLFKHSDPGVGRSVILGPGVPESAMLVPSRSPRRFWHVLPTQYVLEEWSVDGRRLRTIQRQAPWVRENATGAADGSPRARLVSVVEAAPERLWTLTAIPIGGRWRTAPRNESEAVANLAGRFAYVVEVLDVRRGVLIHSQRFESQPYTSLSAEYVIPLLKPDKSGFRTLQVARPLLVQDQPTKEIP